MDISKFFEGETIAPDEGVWIIILNKPLSISLSIPEQIDFMYQNSYMGSCNTVMANMYGFDSQDELIGTPLAELLPITPDNLEFLEKFITNNYKIVEAESKEIDKDGKPVFFLNSMEGIIANGIIVAAKGRQKILKK